MKNTQSWWKTGLVLTSACLFVIGCRDGADNETASTQASVDTQAASQTLTYEQFKAQAYQEKDSGVFIFNGDEMVSNEKKLHEIYEQNFAGKTASQVASASRSIVNTSGGNDTIWSSSQRTNLSYCVSTGFGSNYNTVVSNMASATGAWEAEADINFIHNSGQDSNCTSSNNNVLFDVNPVNVNGQYLARAFFPDDSRSSRNVLIDNSAFAGLSSPLTLTGILRHELGHVLGFRHEHTRPESGTCFEDNNWRALTSYDSDSVMHYPQCNGTGNWSLTLTSRDKTGVSDLYSGSGGGGGTSTSATVSGTVTSGQWKHYYVDAAGGSTMTAAMTGTGDADLYTRVGSQPTSSSYACRPYSSGSSETCNTSVGSSDARVYASINGYASSSNYSLTVTWVPQ